MNPTPAQFEARIRRKVCPLCESPERHTYLLYYCSSECLRAYALQLLSWCRERHQMQDSLS